MSYKSLQKVPSKLEIQCKRGWGGVVRGFLLNGQNPLSVTEVICRWSLKKNERDTRESRRLNRTKTSYHVDCQLVSGRHLFANYEYTRSCTNFF